ncbi:MAG TPA: hypothetical protein VN181_10125, partial [Thermoanaerobaculia bacterium]|nr:hypothetical protein [Thermoanaerobaculia bacterium]
AQEAPAATETTSTAVTTTATPMTTTTSSSSEEVRARFSTVLRESPPQLAGILVLEPTLLSNSAFLAGYPELARFVAEHPEVRLHPAYYLEEFDRPVNNRPFDNVVERLTEFLVALTVVLAFAWLIRTLIEHRRWSRLARVQSEVHNKILDRFGSSEELLQYIKTPAGSKFLESAPITVYSDQAPQNVPMARVLWSIQLGVVIAAASIGMVIVSRQLAGEGAQALFALGVIAFSIGVGFIASALVSLFMSRRLGLWQPSDTPSEP